MLLKRTQKLTKIGVDILCLSCNTVHIFHPKLAASTPVEFVSMIDLVVEKTVRLNLKRVALFATPVTIKSRLYQDKLTSVGVESFTLSTAGQKKYEKVLRAVVAGQVTPNHIQFLFKTASRLYRKHKLNGIILGCTELPLIFPKDRFSGIPILDSLDILADSLLSKINYLTGQ
jgi:aspartate racemase